MSDCLTLLDYEALTADSASPDRRRQLEAHLSTCAVCREGWTRYRAERGLEADLRDAFRVDAGMQVSADAAGLETLDVAAPRSAERPFGDSIPGYSILREIHRGGQGVVYQAVQKATKRKVAIKVMKEGPFADRRDKARFEREVEILGQLNHPFIVGVHDSGDAHGSYYFVMDYISGQPLDVWISSGEHSVEATLGLFVKICEGVNAAHLRGVIHRDLKPGNIRIDAAGEPHILDFGLAKTAAASDVSMMTVTGQFMGSLPWASPEQAEAIPGKIDIRTDVYSLGVILYQMLTGKFPYEVIGSMRDVLDHILKAEPVRPSTIRKQINDEVETIVLKCLCKERERRYQSAGELARDVGHYLAGEPIEAKRDSTLYILKKSLRRYRLPVGIGAAIAVLITATAVAFMLLANRNQDLADSNRRLADQEHASRLRADAATTEMAASRDEAIRQKNDAVQAREEAVAARALETSARREATLRAQEAQQATVEARTQRETATSQAAEAVRQANKAKTISNFLLEMLSHAIPSASTHADLRVHDVLDEAARRIDTDPPADPETEAAVRYTVGVSYLGLGLDEAAEDQMTKALQIRTKVMGPDSLEVADTLFEWARRTYRMNPTRAAEMMGRALVIRRARLGEGHPSTLRTTSWSAALSRSDPDWQTGIVRPYLSLLTGKPGDATAARAWMTELCGRVSSRWRNRDHTGAVDAIREAVAPLLGDPDLRNDVATFISMLPCDSESAEAMARAAVSLSGTTQGGGDFETAVLLGQLAMDLRTRNQPDYREIERLLTRALAICRTVLGEKHFSVMEITHELSATYAQQNRHWRAFRVESKIEDSASTGSKASEYYESWKSNRQESSDFLKRSRRVCSRGWIPDWAPDGKRIAVARPGARGIAIVDLASGEEKDLTSFGKDPAWSPDGRQIVFVNEMEGEATLLIYDFRDGKSRLLGAGHRPRWSSDGKTLYFARWGKPFCIWAMDPNGLSTKPKLIASDVPPGWPTLSPDASSLACVKEDVFVILKLDGTPLISVPAINAVWLHTSWSPDGKQVAFGGGREFAGLSVLDVTSGKLRLMCEGPYVTLAWSADAKHVAFDYRSPEGGEYEVWVADAELVAAQPLLEPSAYSEYLYGRPAEEWVTPPTGSTSSSGKVPSPASSTTVATSRADSNQR